MKTFLSYSIFLITVSSLLLSCSRNEEAGGESAEEAAGEQPTNRVEIPSTVRKNLGITFAKVERRNVETTIRVPGSFELEPLARQEHRLLLPGQVEFAVDELDPVKRGDVLYRFRSPKWLELQSEIDLAKASLKQAETQYEAVSKRLEALRGANFKNAELEAKGAEYQGDLAKRQAEMQAALSRAVRLWNLHDASGADAMKPADLLVEIDREGQKVPFYETINSIEVRASEDGFVESLAVTNGAFVEEATLVLTTVDPKQVRFRAMGLQSDLAEFTEASPVRIVPPQGAGTNINESVEAHLHLGLSADPIQRTVTLLAHPSETRPWIRPGVSAFLEVTSDTSGGIVLRFRAPQS